VFAALQEAFRRTAEQGQVVMVVTFSNACPVPEKTTGEGPCRLGGVRKPPVLPEEAQERQRRWRTPPWSGL